MGDNLSDILNRYNSSPEDDQQYLENLKKSNFEAELKYLEVIEKTQYLTLRKQWSKHIRWSFWIILIFSLLFILLLGSNLLNYTEYKGLPQTILGTFCINIIGLAFVVAKFLFPNSKK